MVRRKEVMYSAILIVSYTSETNRYRAYQFDRIVFTVLRLNDLYQQAYAVEQFTTLWVSTKRFYIDFPMYMHEDTLDLVDDFRVRHSASYDIIILRPSKGPLNPSEERIQFSNKTGKTLWKSVEK